MCRAAELRGESVVLHCDNSDAAIRALLREYPSASDIEIAGAGLEEAFLLLTGDENDRGAVMNLTYLRYELLRSVRNKRAFIFSLVFPLVLFYIVAGANRNINT